MVRGLVHPVLPAADITGPDGCVSKITESNDRQRVFSDIVVTGQPFRPAHSFHPDHKLPVGRDPAHQLFALLGMEGKGILSDRNDLTDNSDVLGQIMLDNRQCGAHPLVVKELQAGLRHGPDVLGPCVVVGVNQIKGGPVDKGQRCRQRIPLEEVDLFASPVPTRGQPLFDDGRHQRTEGGQILGRRIDKPVAGSDHRLALGLDNTDNPLGFSCQVLFGQVSFEIRLTQTRDKVINVFP